MTDLAAKQTFVMWALIIVSILLVTGITYVYTNRDKLITVIFTLCAVLVVGFIKLIGVVQIALKTSFIGAYNENHIAYVVSEPGWEILIHSWNIWILPVACVGILASIIIGCLLYYKKSNAPKVQVITPLSHQPPKSVMQVDRLSSFMAMDAIKKESNDTHEKLSQSLKLNASYELKFSDLTTKIQVLQKDFDEKLQSLDEKNIILNFELKAKTKENGYILEQLATRTQELTKAQTLLKKLIDQHT